MTGLPRCEIEDRLRDHRHPGPQPNLAHELPSVAGPTMPARDGIQEAVGTRQKAATRPTLGIAIEVQR